MKSAESPGVRLDTHIYAGYTVPMHYDSLLGKLIISAETRSLAIARARCALGELCVEGVPTTAGFHSRVLAHPRFQSGNFVNTVYNRKSDCDSN